MEVLMVARGRINAVALHYYVDFYDFTGLRLDHAFRLVTFAPS
jgi:hypothetical protein